jgi:hypothetical protein
MEKLYWTLIIGLFAFLIILKIADTFDGRFSSVEVLSKECYEESRYSYRIGAICEDGWRSSATGRGACSQHGGVDKWKLDYAYNKNMEECKEWSKDRSWIE